MREYTSVSELVDYLREEQASFTRFPVRFILVRGLNAWRDLLDNFMVLVDEIFYLSSLCTGKDIFPRTDDLMKWLNSNKNKNTGVLPLAEILRFTDMNQGLLRQLAEWENPGKTRVYIPLMEAGDILETELQKSLRFKAGELAEVCGLNGQGMVKLTIAPFALKLPNVEISTGLSRYLSLWESGGAGSIVLVTKLAPYLNESMGNFAVEVFKNSYELIKKQNSQAFSIEWGTNKQWDWLASITYPHETLRDTSTRIFNVKTFDPWQLYALWSTFEEEKKWLLWIWSKIELEKTQGYLGFVTAHSSNYGSFQEELIMRVFEVPLTYSIARERRNLLDLLHITHIPRVFWQQFAALEDPTQKLEVLSGVTEEEKEQIVTIVGELLASNRDRQEWWTYVELSFPELAMYLTPLEYEDEFVNEYFTLYTRSKVVDKPLEQLAFFAQKAAALQKIWDFGHRDGSLESERECKSKILWIDGMGLEWVSLLMELLRKKGEYRIELEVARTNLPTTTEYNRGWQDESEVERGIDEIAHKHNYALPGSLIEGIRVISRVAAKIENYLKQYNKIIVTADHGLSRFAANGSKIQAPEGADVQQWGRYAIISDVNAQVLYDNHSEKPWVIDGNKVFLAVHEKFVGGGGSIGEVHGGASLEEALVPILRISKYDVAKSNMKPTYAIKERVIKISAKGEALIEIDVHGTVERLILKISGTKFMGTRKLNHWVIRVRSLKAGKYKGMLDSDLGILGEVDFELVKGIIIEDMDL